ncbi:hypothetical protein [Exiguobacterium sp. s123]|nr:hypothetical protein [Exiguobacterium sp. s123]
MLIIRAGSDRVHHFSHKQSKS